MYRLRTIYAYAGCLFLLLTYIPAMFRAKRLKKKGDPESLAQREELVRRLVKRWGILVLKMSKTEVTVSGLENIPDVPCVLVGNHQGYFDIIALLGAMDHTRAFMGQILFKKIPLLSGWMQNLDCVFVDRSNAKQSMTAIHESEELLKSGKDIYVFPEGTRSKSNTIGEFKNGAFRMATKTGSPVVPFLIDGTYKVLESNHMWIKPAHVKITILPAIDTSTLSKAEINGMTQHVRELIIAEQERQKSLKEDEEQ